MTEATPMEPGRASPPPRGALGVVFATILIDFVGFSILIPVLPLYAADLGATPMQIGLILSVYAMAQLLFLPAWGWVSDRFGRRPVILISLLGTSVSFLVLAAAQTLPTIYLARILGGFFAASIGTAQAVVTDLTPVSDRARGMGLIGAAFGLGFVIGNFVGGELAAWHARLPFLAVSALSLSNLVVAWFRLPESRPPTSAPARWRELPRTLVPAPLRLVAAVHERRIALYLLLFFLLFTSFAALESMFAVYLRARFDLGFQAAGRIFAYIGLFIALTQGLLVGRLAHRFSERTMVAVGFLATGMGLAAVSFVPAYGWFFVIGPVIAFGNGIALPSFTSLYSKACHQDQTGELLGESQAMATTGRIVGPIWAGGAFESLAPAAPFVIAGGLTLVALAIFVAARDRLGAEKSGGEMSPTGAGFG